MSLLSKAYFLKNIEALSITYANQNVNALQQSQTNANIVYYSSIILTGGTIKIIYLFVDRKGLSYKQVANQYGCVKAHSYFFNTLSFLFISD
ncbi:hypothetical protein [Acinetobacter sp. 1000160]|uniref:hypothetical protein n=1 Tax=Acinetobacter sp. 1000160 TaxID=1310800 RepID=UPI00044BA450|nr:hypothetical protein [Acinetobacter sp. 1000160]EXB46249.1 hypothetical protein J522_3170 [Acinetobacter baumannii 146457]EYT16967.1 hypothetical protein J699_02884 [Acinetobacter sp. 1000160]